MYSGEPRHSTDNENAPLLRDPETERGSSMDGRSPIPPIRAREGKPFSAHVDDILREPLTTLTKILLIITLFLLLLTSVFVGLFAGAEYKLNHQRGVRRPPDFPVTRTRTSTVLATTTETTIGTTRLTTTTAQTLTSTTTVKGPGPTTFPRPPPPTTVTVPAPLPTGGPGSGLCTSSDCVVLSASILQGLDQTQDPCENFYDFSNGGWLAKHEIPSGKGAYGTFNQVSDENKRILRNILDPPTDETSYSSSDPYDNETVTKLRDLHSSCMNEGLLNERGDQPLKDIVRVVRDLYRSDSWKEMATVNGESDNVEKTMNPQYGLTAAISYLHSRGIGGLFDFDIDGDVGVDPNYMTLWFSQPELGLPSKEYYDEKEIVKLYRDTLAQMLLALDDNPEEVMSGRASGDDSLVVETEEKMKIWPPWPWPPWGGDDDDDSDGRQPANRTEYAHQLAKDVVKFEKRIANASLDLEVLLQDPVATYNPVEFPDLALQVPQIDFPSYFSAFTPRNLPTRVILTSTTYGESLSSILSSTEPSTIEAYLVTRASLALAPLLGYETEVWKADRAMKETLQGIKRGAVPDREEWCVQQVENSLGFAAGRFFVQRAFGGDSKAKGTKVITDIIDAFKQSLKDVKWMDEESAKAAAEKADAINVKVGYPLSPNTESSRSIALYYRLVFVDKAEFFESVVSAQISEVFREWQKLGKQRDKQEWGMPPSMVNAYFNPPANEIVFPAGILQPPFFASKWPAYIQYGAFGMVAAHELTHAFDSAGRMYNQQGKLEQWWTNKTSEGFEKVQKCIAEQYSQYTIDDGKGGKIHVNGNLTSGENIGDTGIIQAYRAWRGQFHTESSLEPTMEPLLPGLNYTQEQLFFIGFGQIWAQKIKPAAAVQRVRTDPHSPNKYRVDGTLANVPEFAAAFQCKVGSKLNPPKEKKCILW